MIRKQGLRYCKQQALFDFGLKALVVLIIACVPAFTLVAAVGDADDDGLPDTLELVNGRPVDTDLDGVPDYLDTDSDNDGILDSVEGAVDANGNGVPDYRDFISDGDLDLDGIPDSVEGTGDLDGDGIANFLDADSDNDGLTDALELKSATMGVDSDGDLIPDFQDRDSDNDGISDAAEAGLDDLDFNGFVDSFSDLDRDGVHDGIDLSAIESSDLDGDGTLNHVDLDSDGDGKFDLTEIGGIDSNGDGRLDAWADTDADGVPDYADADITGGGDSDGDGIVDFADIDTYPSGTDSDLDGIENTYDLDSYDSGFIALHLAEPSLGAALPDTDADGVPDYLQNGSAAGAGDSGGCSVGKPGHFDPVLLLLGLLSFFALFRKRRAL